jgi:hypothetical protein
MRQPASELPVRTPSSGEMRQNIALRHNAPKNARMPRTYRSSLTPRRNVKLAHAQGAG